MKFVQHFSWHSSKCCNKLHLKLFSFLEISYQLHEKKGNFMLYNLYSQQFCSKLLCFSIKLKKKKLFIKFKMAGGFWIPTSEIWPTGCDVIFLRPIEDEHWNVIGMPADPRVINSQHRHTHKRKTHPRMALDWI